jgi:folate-binding protein YgfZ
MNLWIPLISRHVVRLVGKQALHFLQGLTTYDMRLVKEGEAVFTAFLNRQGRFLADGFVVQHQESIYLEYDNVHDEVLNTLCKTYGPLNGVSLKRMPWVVFSFMGPQAHTLAPDVAAALSAPSVCYADPRDPELGIRSIVAYQHWHTIPHELCVPASEHDYHRACVSLGIPSGSLDLVFERSLILEYDYHVHHAVSWNKGCYLGQEVMARSFYQDRFRRSLFRLSHLQFPLDLPKAGDKILDTDYVHQGYWGSPIEQQCLVCLDRDWAFERITSSSELRISTESGDCITATLEALHTPHIPQHAIK